MTWNVLLGGEDRFDRVLARISSAAPDVLVLQECVGWEDGARLAAVADAAGLPHTFLGRARPRGSGRRFNVAVASRHELAFTRCHADPAVFGHCCVEVGFEHVGERVGLLGTHFDAHAEDPRVVEARAVGALVPPRRLAAERWILAGDLNALSPRDPYPPDLDARLRAAGTEKYGNPARFEAIPILEAGGWVDTLHAFGPPLDWVTARRDRGGVRIDYRTDYILASPPMAARLSRASILAAGGASDHEPVVAEFTS